MDHPHPASSSASSLSGIENFDLSFSSTSDEPHCQHLGVVKHTMSSVLETMSKAEKVKLDEKFDLEFCLFSLQVF